MNATISKTEISEDLQYVLEGNREKLWLKYERYVRGVLIKRQIFDIEDALQDAYFVLERCLVTIDLEKIKNRNSWEFKKRLSCLLFHFCRTVNRETRTVYNNETAYDVLESIIEGRHPGYRKFQPGFSTENQSIKEMRDVLLSVLSERQRNILRLRRAGQTIQEIANRYNYSTGVISQEIRRARKKAEEVFGIEHKGIGKFKMEDLPMNHPEIDRLLAIDDEAEQAVATQQALDQGLISQVEYDIILAPDY
jgi:RNA polymerase sigma factor (sigma-70 family)